MTTITVGDSLGLTRGVFNAITRIRIRSAQVGFSLEGNA